MQRYATDLVVGVDDFRDSGWQAAIAAADGNGYPGIFNELSKAAQSATEAGEASRAKVLWLLGDACSMVLDLASTSQPFKPWMVMNGTPTRLPEDFSDTDIDFFALVVDETGSPWLQARLAELVWLLRKSPQGPTYALKAIDAYMGIPLDTGTWGHGGDACWKRAISLCRRLGVVAGERLKAMETAVVAAFRATDSEDRFFALGLADMLAANDLAQGEAPATAAKLESLARTFDEQGDLHAAREFSIAAVKWSRLAGDETKATEMTVFLAEEWVKDARAWSSGDRPSHGVSAIFYEKAIQTYRSIPGKERADYRADERIIELQRSLREAGAWSLSEMKTTSTEPVDITGMVDIGREAVIGKSVWDALAALVSVYRGAHVTDLRERSEETLKEFPLRTLISTFYTSNDGRVIAKHPGTRSSDSTPDDHQAVLSMEMAKRYSIEISLVVQGLVLPALEVMVREHRLCQGDFDAIAAGSPIVPSGREHLVGKGLFAGYEGDFATAVYLLVPQIEHMVRCGFRAADIKTTTLDQNGIETENGLGSLMGLPEASRIFGEDLTFEFRALFTDPVGPNLRNRLAHGLLGDEDCRSAYAVYAWWFGLKLVFSTFWAARTQTDVTADVTADVDKGG